MIPMVFASGRISRIIFNWLSNRKLVAGTGDLADRGSVCVCQFCGNRIGNCGDRSPEYQIFLATLYAALSHRGCNATDQIYLLACKGSWRSGWRCRRLPVHSHKERLSSCPSTMPSCCKALLRNPSRQLSREPCSANWPIPMV